jgi:pimeloyl-ACP methyl ester carboxylesterase
MNQAKTHSRRIIRRIRITGWTAVTALLVTIVSFLTWFHIVLPADRPALDALFVDESIVVSAADGLITASPAGGESTQGLVFYPGAKVDPYAYLPPFQELVAEGLTVVIVEPLFNMALFDTTPFEEATGKAPGISEWFVGGHSLGAVKACAVAEVEAVAGLLLMAGFCATDLSGQDLTVLQLSGDQDELLDPLAQAEARALLPVGAEERVIPGANHASFGAYGPQGGDGVATLSKEAGYAAFQDAITTDLLTP